MVDVELAQADGSPICGASADVDVRASHSLVMGTTGGGPANLDLGKLLATRLLIQAGSGGGKSWLLRRLLEQSHAMVRQIVFDPEGELVTLAEQFDYTVCAPDSPTAPIWPGGGAAAARLIYESRRSAIISLSEFELEDMHEFVADFCRELLRMPQESWHHLMVAFDEAQLFAPQHDKASSKKPLIDLARRGRKRGICSVCATQRLSELSKGVAGQLENKLIGLTTLDVDIERAADVLGMRPINARSVLRKLQPGHFIAFGPALGYELEDVAIGPVRTRHGILASYAGRPVEPTVSADTLAASLREGALCGEGAAAAGSTVGPSGLGPLLSNDQLRQVVVQFALQHGPASTAAEFESARRLVHGFLADTLTPGGPPKRSREFRCRVVDMAHRLGADAAAAHFDVSRSSVYRWLGQAAQATSSESAPMTDSDVTPAKQRRRCRRRGAKVHLNALAPAHKLDRVFGAAVAVLNGESIDEVASRHGRRPVAARRWVRAALAHVDLGKLGLEGKHVRLERLRSHAAQIVPRLKRALAQEKKSIAR